MAERAETVLAWLVALPDWLVYLVAALAAALENLVPPIPADLVVVAAGVVAGAGAARPWLVFVAVWFANVATALLVYAFGRRYGPAFFAGRFGGYLLAPSQVEGLAFAYRRFGFPIIFLSRFLPVFRPMVPAFAGVAHLGILATAVPIAAASAVWYGMLVFLGATAGENWHAVLALLGRAGGWLWLTAILLLVALAWWWWRSRRGAPPADLDSGHELG
jgi:membrane protein DedA with SNARE-associated domain